MKTNSQPREQLRAWLAKCNEGIAAELLTDDLALIENRIITSLHLVELLLFIEQLRGHAVALEEIQPQAFHSINSICAHFLVEENDYDNA